MREELLNELEQEYTAKRTENERKEAERREIIRTEYPDIYRLTREREELIHGTIRGILNGTAQGEKLPERMEEMNLRIRKLLVQYGLPENYLEPIYDCPVCRDRGYVENPLKEPCQCMKAAYQRILRRSIGLNSGGNESFETFDISRLPDVPVPGRRYTQRTMAVVAKEQCEEWANTYPDSPWTNILLSGKSGLGKTFLMHAMAGRLIERGHNVLIISAYQFIQLARKSYFDGDDSLDELMKVPVLMIDDLGSEPMMKSITVEQLFNLINERQNRNLTTVISSNLTVEEMKERYTERITSRINDPRKCLVLVLEGQDLRMLKENRP